MTGIADRECSILAASNGMSGKCPGDDLLSVPIAPASAREISTLQALARKLMREDLPVAVSDSDAGIELQADTERDMEVFFLELSNTFPDAKAGGPQVLYREMLTRPTTVEYVHKKQMEGWGEFAVVQITFSPGEANSGFTFGNEIDQGTVPDDFVPIIEHTIEREKDAGLIWGFPLVDFKAVLRDGKYHEVDSSEHAFATAARAAFREMAMTGAVRLVEPVLLVEVQIPEDFLGGVIGDLNSRRGTILETDGTDTGMQVVIAHVPAASMIGYMNTLMSMTQGRAHYTALFDHYEPVPGEPYHDPKEPLAAAVGVPRTQPVDAIATGGKVVPFPTRRPSPKVGV